MQNTRSHKRRGEKLPEFAKNLNASQRACLTKLTKTGERDMTNKVTAERPMRTAAWDARKSRQEAA
jgi:hypothetical protein